MSKNIKSGQYVMKGAIQYLFLGYSDYKRKLCVLADMDGNKHEAWVTDVSPLN